MQTISYVSDLRKGSSTTTTPARLFENPRGYLVPATGIIVMRGITIADIRTRFACQEYARSRFEVAR